MAEEGHVCVVGMGSVNHVECSYLVKLMSLLTTSLMVNARRKKHGGASIAPKSTAREISTKCFTYARQRNSDALHFYIPNVTLASTKRRRDGLSGEPEYEHMAKGK